MADLVRPAGTTGHVVFRGEDDAHSLNVADMFLNARAADLYRAFTNPDRLAAWTKGRTPEQADRTLVLEIPDLGTTAQLTVDEPNTRVGFTWRQDGWALPETQVSIDFHPTLRATLLTVTHTGLAEADVDAARALWRNHLQSRLHRGLIRDSGPVAVVMGRPS